MSSLVKSFVDDSGSGGDSRYYVLAGYSATVEEWERFADLWQTEIDKEPAIAYFKMREAESLRGQFSGWLPEQRDTKVKSLIGIIESCNLWEASIAASAKDYRILEPILTDDFRDPYLVCFCCIVAAFQLRHPHSKIDFVFDKDERNERNAKGLYLIGQDILKKPGAFGRIDYEDDQDFVPLQAADLIAWQNRRILCSSEAVRPEIKRLHANTLRWFRKVLYRTDMEELLSYMIEFLEAVKSGVKLQLDAGRMILTNPKFME